MFSKFPRAGAGAGLQSACGCLSLRAACLLTGILSILYSTLALALGLAAAQEGAGGGGGGAGGGVYFLLVMTVQLVTLLLSALMLVGAITERAWMVRPWVVVKSAHVCVSALLLVCAGVARVFMPPSVSPSPGPAAPPSTAPSPAHQLLLAGAQLLVILVWVYMVVVAASFLRQLEERRDERTRLSSLHTDTWYSEP